MQLNQAQFAYPFGFLVSLEIVICSDIVGDKRFNVSPWRSDTPLLVFSGTRHAYDAYTYMEAKGLSTQNNKS